jgi:hypothetical protein
LATQVQAAVRQRFHYWYFQDDLKVNNRLTLNLGLRYEFVTPMYDENNFLTNFDPQTRSLVRATDGGSISERSLRDTDKNNFAPRIGLAYKLMDKTVIRAGYALNYNYWNRMASAELLNTNAPFVTRGSVANTASTLGNNCTGNNFVGCFRRTQDGYPTNLLSAPGQRDSVYAARHAWSYVQNYHLTLQHQLTQDLLIDVAYVGNRSVKLPLLGVFVVPASAGTVVAIEIRLLF